MAFWARTSGDNLQVPEDDGPSRLSASHRDGKFRNLSEFMKVGKDDKSVREGYKAIGVTNIQPGHIIHVCDEKSRLDRRVMLVLRRSTMSFTCLTFCAHFPPPGPEDHWRVCDEGKAQESIEDPKLSKLQPLEVVLQPYGRASRVSPEPDVTINIQDIWNVENEVNVKVLGEVVGSSLPRLVKAIKTLFSQNLDGAVPPVDEQKKDRRDSKNAESRPKPVVKKQKRGLF